jgi:hypothetical protein
MSRSTLVTALLKNYTHRVLRETPGEPRFQAAAAPAVCSPRPSPLLPIRYQTTPETASRAPQRAEESMQKLFVVDTNVVLFDHSCIYSFEEHDVAIPIVVLEELDRFKRGNDLINIEARQFIRELDRLAGDGPLTEGLPLGEGRGRLWVEVGEPRAGRVTQALSSGKPDHRILALA